MSDQNDIQQAIDLLMENGYSVRKSVRGLYTKPGSLKNYRENIKGDKVVFSCFKSRLRQAGMLSDRRQQGDISWALYG